MWNGRLSRRGFLKAGGGALSASAAGLLMTRLGFLQPIQSVDNPLDYYPNRDWEKVYRDLFRHDQQFTFLCAPNDTHNCLLKANVKKGVITRIEPSYAYGEAVDPYGNKASHRWEPRACQKGLAMVRKFYGDRRIKGAMVRKGFLEWAEAGYPRDPSTGRGDPKYFQRGKDEWVRLPWDEAYALVARSAVNIAETYSGAQGARYLQAQEYDPAMIAKVDGKGVRTMKFRGGMPFLGATRCYGQYRNANSMALLDAHIRGVGADQAVGATGWDNYTWHTDLPPGHPMVTGQQTIDFDLFTAENAKLITLWGMNWISTKMPDGHWLTESRIRGSKVIVIACEYQSTANKADEVIIIRPGTDAALALGACHVILKENLYDVDYVKTFTDLPLLVRMDNLKMLRASDVIPGYQPADLKNYTKVLEAGQAPPTHEQHDSQYITREMRDEWNDHVVWDLNRGGVAAVTRDQVGQHFNETGLNPALEGSFTVTTVDGQTIEVRPVLDLMRTYLENYDPDTVQSITWAPKEAVINLGRQIAANKESTLLTHGMGPNHFFNADLKDRALLLLAALTRNIGYLGGTPGSYAGNYRGALFTGVPYYVTEDPFNPQLDPAGTIQRKGYYRMESAHFYNYGDRPLRVGNKLFTGDTHIPTPSKFCWWANSNSILGNAKWSYDVIHNTLPRIECIVVNEWWWTMTAEYADVVFGVDSWAEFKHPDMAGSVTNPFVTIYPRTPLQRIFDTQADIETYAGVGKALAEITGERRFVDYWKFVHDHRVDVYLQRIIDHSTSLRGYRFDDLENKAKKGIPALKLLRTYPKVVGWEQSHESKPWYTKTGRCEFYREENEWIEYGENMSVYREPVDGTFYEPNIIVGKEHPAIRQSTPDKYGLSTDDLSVEVRQVRNVRKAWSEAKDSPHPRIKDGFKFIFITPKYRHGAHTTPIDLDVISVYFGPFGDVYRRDNRKPWVGEGYADINPDDARELGVNDGDYIWIDADPEDRPYRGWKPEDDDYKVMRLMCRARFYRGTPRGILRMWFHMYQASHGTVEAHESRPDKLAKNPRSGYQAMFRYGGHQSTTRAWLRPTLLTDSLVRKGTWGQLIGKGFEPDVHAANGAPKESFVKVSKAEDGGIDGQGMWRPAQLGFRPTYENDAMQRFLQGGFIDVR